MVYEINFKRLKNEVPMVAVLRRPYADEVEDYKEYKRMRQVVRDAREHTAAAQMRPTPTLTVSSGSFYGETPVARQDSVY